MAAAPSAITQNHKATSPFLAPFPPPCFSASQLTNTTITQFHHGSKLNFHLLLSLLFLFLQINNQSFSNLVFFFCRFASSPAKQRRCSRLYHGRNHRCFAQPAHHRSQSGNPQRLASLSLSRSDFSSPAPFLSHDFAAEIADAGPHRTCFATASPHLPPP